MSAQALARRHSRRLRLGMVLALLLAVAGLTLVSQLHSQAQTTPLTPTVNAFYPSDSKLVVVVNLTAADRQAATGDLSVAVLDAAGQSVAQATQALQGRAVPASAHFELKTAKADAAKHTLRIQLGKRQTTVPLSKVLLAKGHETSLFTGQEFFAGSTSPFRLDVHGVRSERETVPLAGAEVVVQLRDKNNKEHILYKGKTNSAGKVENQLRVPALPSGQYTLEVVTRSPLGEEKLTQSIRLKADAKILLVSDKPIYQPGQTMHLRALALRPFDLKPVQQASVVFEVEDSKGNKVFKKTLQTSDFGVTSLDFELATEVNMGNYQIRAIMGESRAEKTVQVKRYQLPKFKTSVNADKTFYLPKETIKVELQSDYFFGKPVANAKVKVAASTFDVQFREFQKWEGTTDANGHVKFEVKLPDYFVGQPLQKGNALVKLDVKLTDSADHTEEIVKTYTVSDQPIQVNLIPEGGKLVPNMKNRVFAAAVYPDGSPARCEVQLWTGKEAKGKPLTTVKTNDAGLAEFQFTPKADQFRKGQYQQQNVEMIGGSRLLNVPAVLLDMYAQARDPKGNTAKKHMELNSQPLGENILLRLDKAIYQSAESLKADIRTSAGLPTVYLDIVRGGQIALSQWLEVKDGKASYTLDLPQDIFGTVEVHAYQMLYSGEIIRDSRVVYVQPRNDLKIEVKASKSVFAPGDNGRIHFAVTDANGKGTAAALGIIIVDEAVYALQDLQPGLEKVYFTLQEELLKPQAQVLKYEPAENLNALIRQPVLPAPKQQVAEVLLTSVKVQPPARWQVAPAVERKNQYESRVQEVGWSVYRYAWFTNAGLQRNETTGTWSFPPNVLDKMAQAGYFNPGSLTTPLGQKLSLESLQKTEKSFNAALLGQAITHHRMEKLADALVTYAEANKDKWYQDGRWRLPENALAKAATAKGLPVHYLRDAWGQGFKLVHSVKKLANKTGQSQFNYYDIVSAGPDRDYLSGDDVRWTRISQDKAAGGWWANSDRVQYAFQSGFRGRQEELAQMLMDQDGINRHGKELQMLQRFDGKDHFREMQRAEFPMGAKGAGRPGAMPPMANMPFDKAAKTDAAGAPAGGGEQSGGAAAPAVKVREYFPETMLWQPALITDDDGKADLAVNFADSITTWRLTASASSKGGALGGATTALKVFQEFFVDIDLPLTLTQNDEVAFPVAVYNYLKTPQTVKLQLEQEPWFNLTDNQGLTRTLKLKPGEVTAVHFRIRANRIGFQPLTVKAFGSTKADAVKRLVEVVPDGRKVETVINDQLKGKVSQTITIPQEAIADSSKMVVRIYPGIMAQVVEGLEGMLRMPGGCFEQTSSSAYPNILIVDYIKKNKLANPQLLLKAESHLNAGYQRLLTFERPGGGFDWWGSGEPLVWLSAYGLQEFNDMSKVWPVDRGIIDRTQNFLMKKMNADGTWDNIGATHSETIANMGNPKLLLTSYVAWSLLESGMPKDKLAKSVTYIRDHIKDADNNAYVLALAANALASFDAKDDSTLQALQKLEALHENVPEWKAQRFPAKGQSLNYAHGNHVTIETTALTVLAMSKSGQFTNSVNKSLMYLIKSKDGNGSWGSTSATILAMKALLAGMTAPEIKGQIDVTILVNGKEAARSQITQENADVMQIFDLKEHTKVGANQVEIRTTGETSLLYQVVGRYYEPWKKDTRPVEAPEFKLNVAYDREKLTTHDMLKATATVQYNGKLPANMVMVDLGIAPGFNVDPGDFAEMVDRKQISKFSITSRQVILYLNGLRPGETKTFEYTLKARFPLRAQTPASVVYEYYTPTNRAVAPPVALTVTAQK